MKKSFLLLVTAIISSVGMFAQSSMLATLSHEGKITAFYGSSALKEAYEAAVSGDVVTLSSGTFTSTDIKKAITLRGAGMGIDSTALQKDATVIAGNFDIDLPDTETGRLVIEGIYNNNYVKYGTVNNATFLKCRFSEFVYLDDNSILKDASFIHCRIARKLDVVNGAALCVNSVLEDPGASYSSGIIEFVNCIVRNCGSVGYSSFKNCIIFTSYPTSSGLDPFCTVYNCIGYGSNRLFESVSNSTNTFINNPESIFLTYKDHNKDFSKSDTERFVLTDEAKAKYLGNDNTEVGIYGGLFPYNPNPSIPQIVKCDVPPQSTPDGKLSVDLQIAVAE